MKKYIIFTMTALVLVSCGEDWLDINQDPNNPQTGTLSLILPAAQTAKAFGMTRDINKNTMVFTRQLYNLSESQYTQDPTTYSNDYDGLFGNVLKEMEEIIEQGTEQEAWNFVGIAKIMKAHTYMVMVDLWGDLPYTEALNGEETLSPEFTPAATIYDALLLLIDEGVADLAKESTLNVEGDLIYNGDLDQWETAANTLKLRMLLNLRLVDPARATSGINALIAEGNLISDNSDDYEFRFGGSLTPNNRHPLYQIEYVDGNKTYHMSNYFMYNLIKKEDPRLPFYIYRQGTDSELDFETTPCSNRSDCVYGLLSGTDLGEVAEGYIGRDHGDPSGIPGDNSIRATFGVYPIGGEYDDNSRNDAGQGDGGQGAGVIPYLSNTMRAFMLAEAKLTLPGMTGGQSAEAYLEEGIRSSMEKVEDLGLSLDEDAEPMDEAAVEAYVAARLAEYAAATDALKLNVIIKEKYYAQFGNGMEAFTDLRRTGYPADLPASLAPAAPFPLRLPYSITELNTNSNAPSPPPVLDSPVFWDVN
ncbi:SusD/RagB family nutrient-binding outer membrane lipoprotein [Catalinimonas niigatensis]|uniref:SusD/RagB family nutrient-binding outer membrane lipoprotein n=1 Tax=Catalinimonas niigatensis TaxID=1397264 RepID=UPI0026671071|nr:SusD/RagB family nutrient-binding outer membrane lipoprotein [Catalinimonas niigatensis]WPP52253.1 SusD/RagB family nutrient-binding outer membrane lipoprotein [Catalinimonas niigatensis]